MPVPRARVSQAVKSGGARYIAECRDRLPGFIERNFSVRGALGLNRHAIGWDLLRAPANLALAVPQFGLYGLSAALRQTGHGAAAEALAARSILFRTAVAREIAWRLHVELLQLPIRQSWRGRMRESTDDALAAAILADPLLADAFGDLAETLAVHGRDPGFARRLADKLAIYCDSRAAAAELTTALINLGTGAAAFGKATPTAFTLGPALAGFIAHSHAVAGFPLGSSAAAFWYGLFPASPGLLLTGGAVGGVMVAGAVIAAFAGIVADPAQKALGIHRRRLEKLLDAMERDLAGSGDGAYVLRDHYVARILDFVDIIRAVARLA